jgi:hypothetical protein
MLRFVWVIFSFLSPNCAGFSALIAILIHSWNVPIVVIVGHFYIWHVHLSLWCGWANRWKVSLRLGFPHIQIS